MKSKLLAGAAALAYDLAVFIGRFQPLHKGHLHVIREALKNARYALLVVGSAGEARRPDRLPFTAEERRQMILACLTPEEQERVIILFAEDLNNMTLWTEQIQGLAHEACTALGLGPDCKITLIGHSKDRSSYYLKAFPQWDAIDVGHHQELSATPMRDRYFGPQALDYLNGDAKRDLPDGVIDWLKDFLGTPIYEDLVGELEFVAKYKLAWKDAPYPPTFVTTDACVIQGANILLIQRRARPGKGLWAMPGGFLEQDEFIIDGAIRELREETKLKVPESVLRGSIEATQVFDNPYRSMRGRTITHCVLFHLDPKVPDQRPGESQAAYMKRVEEALELPFVKGSDDAAKAVWVPLDQVRRDMMFEDHYTMIQTMKAKIRKPE